MITTLIDPVKLECIRLLNEGNFTSENLHLETKKDYSPGIGPGWGGGALNKELQKGTYLPAESLNFSEKDIFAPQKCKRSSSRSLKKGTGPINFNRKKAALVLTAI